MTNRSLHTIILCVKYASATLPYSNKLIYYHSCVINMKLVVIVSCRYQLRCRIEMTNLIEFYDSLSIT